LGFFSGGRRGQFCIATTGFDDRLLAQLTVSLFLLRQFSAAASTSEKSKIAPSGTSPFKFAAGQHPGPICSKWGVDSGEPNVDLEKTAKMDECEKGLLGLASRYVALNKAPPAPSELM
jgi:hypothetical protein